MHIYIIVMYDIDFLIELALKEDLGDGDHTSLATIPLNTKGKARLLVKEPAVLAGVEMAQKIYAMFDKNLKMKITFNDGDSVESGDVAYTVEGNIHSILSTERLVLNFMQRMSGIATHTARLVALTQGLKTKLLDTRKTTPCLREIEKWAVRIGGGINHRNGLYDMIMIKDNHIDFCGGIEKAIMATIDYLNTTGKSLYIIIEARSMADVSEIMRVGQVQRIMLDNFEVPVLKEAVKLINGNFETEASGGINEKNLRAYAETGVDYISIGALTHQIHSIDMSLKAEI